MTFSLDELDATKASDAAFEFEVVSAQGELTGIFLKVLGGQSEVVTKEVARLVNERRRKEAAREIARKASVGVKTIDFETLESDLTFAQRLASVRLVGWRGISDAFTPEGALKLCQTNRHISAQITAQSDEMSNFMLG